MPAKLDHIRNLLLPGLWEISGSVMPATWVAVFEAEAATTLPLVSLPAAVLMGAAAVVIKNPEVTRRFWAKEL